MLASSFDIPLLRGHDAQNAEMHDKDGEAFRNMLPLYAEHETVSTLMPGPGATPLRSGSPTRVASEHPLPILEAGAVRKALYTTSSLL